MLTKQYRDLLKLFLTADYITAKHISEMLDISERSVRNRVKEINAAYKAEHITIHSKPRYGFFVEPEVRERILLLLGTDRSDSHVPVSSEERFQFLSVYLLNLKNFIKADELCDLMFVSRGTLSAALKKVENLYSDFNIEIIRRPNYGIKAVGAELDIRRFLCDIFVRHEFLWEIGKRHQQETLKRIGLIVRKNMQAFERVFSETAFQTFLEYIYIAIQRIREEHFISIDLDKRDYLERNDYYFVESLITDLQNEFTVVWPESEKLSLAVWMCGNNSREQLVQYKQNIVIKNDIYKLTGEILEAVYLEFHIDLRDNLELRMSLVQHMMPMDIRLKYGLKSANPLLPDIRAMYPLAYRIAEFMAESLEKRYGAAVSEEETGYLAVIFELALQKADSEPERKAVLLVCASGRGTAQLLKHQMARKFHDYIGHLNVKGIYELEEADFAGIDLVVTTVPLSRKISVPIIEINELMTEDDQTDMRMALQSDKPFIWENYYKKNLFFPRIAGQTKEEILSQLCGLISVQYPMPADFYESVMNRERMSSTDIGSSSALPHPDRLIAERTLMAAAVLEHPVFWGRKEVSLVILALIGKKENPDIQKIYDGTIRLLSDKTAVRELTEKRDYGTLLSLMK